MQAAKLTHAATYSSLLHTRLSSARTILGVDQRPNRSSTPQQQQPQQLFRNPDSRTLPIDSADLQPVLNPSVLNRTRPRPAPAPSATSAAAGEATLQEPYTGPTVKPVSEVQAGDSCVCWTPDLCTCGWQSCPYQPPDRVSESLLSESAQLLFGPDVLPQLAMSVDAPADRVAPLLP